MVYNIEFFLNQFKLNEQNKYLRKKNMKFNLDLDYYIDTDKPLDISIPLVAGTDNLRAWYVDPPKMTPVMEHGFNGSVEGGGAVNFRNIFFNPHGHGTHTECLGHITKEIFSINKTMRTFFSKAQLITIEPIEIINTEYKEKDHVITLEQLEMISFEEGIESLIIRTKPNSLEKTHKNYSATNPPYLSIECIELIESLKIKHLLIDLPSVDRESDGGKLVFHHAFWGVPDNPNYERTITELIYIEDTIKDGVYILDLQVAPFENDASPSRPVLYERLKS